MRSPTASVPSVDRKSTRLNSSHDQISYAVFCLKKKKVVIFIEARRTQTYQLKIGAAGLVLCLLIYFSALIAGVGLAGIFLSALLIFFFNDTATTEIYTLSLHDALPIFDARHPVHVGGGAGVRTGRSVALRRSEEHTSELQSRSDLVCRLLIEKKKTVPLTATISMTIFSYMMENIKDKHL